MLFSDDFSETMQRIFTTNFDADARIRRVTSNPDKYPKYFIPPNITDSESELDNFRKYGTIYIRNLNEFFQEVLDYKELTKFYNHGLTNGFFQKKKGPKGEEYYRTRGPSGYQLVTDICLFGEQEFRKPSTCGVIYGISY